MPHLLERRPVYRRADARLSSHSIKVQGEPIGPVRRGDALLWLRPPRVLDGPAWRDTCLREEDRLAHVLRSPDRSWAESLSTAAWVERVQAQRAATRAGLLIPYVAVLDDGRVVGEISFAIDPRTGVAEASLWVSRDVPRGARAWLIGMSIMRVLSLPDPIARIIAPVACSNPGPAALFAQLGFTRAVHSEQLRWYDDRWADHNVWWLDTGPDVLTHLGRVLTARTPPDILGGERTISGPARRRDAWRAAALAWLRVRLRAARRWRPPSSHLASATHGEVSFPLGRVGSLKIAGRPMGLIDVRHDPGTSTLEIWTRIDEDAVADRVAPALLRHARAVGARRISWSLKPDSPDQAAAKVAGFRPEGMATAPVWVEPGQHEMWARLLGDDQSSPS